MWVFMGRSPARAAQNGDACAAAASLKNAVDRLVQSAYTSCSRRTWRSTAAPAIAEFVRQVFVTTAARQPDKSAFFTPAEARGSMNDAASPTRSILLSAARTQS